ncbi:CD109 antigen-like [Paramacrobiotus metropolitanus]|uniref:CD109 antigen-like n=1 Tax=Paramacrobiotus metropolitanus TaxID=2943436 RepID=UPI0024464FFD|nr:CD109 antigen-like [Paramacrobiotus metropolitanus]
MADANGDVVLERKVPDALTTWDIWAFSFSSTDGLTAAIKPIKLKVFKSLLASLEIPYSVIRHENFTAEVFISNYLPHQQDVTVNLTIRSPDNTVITFTKNIISEPNGTVTAEFTIIPEEIGDWELEVTVQSALGSHQLNKILLVKSEGVTQSYSQPILVDLHKSNVFDTTIQLPIDPVDKVTGSEKVTVDVVGDILGVSIRNVEKLIRLRLPTGFCEPNMAMVASSVAMLKYLRNINQKLPQKEKDLVSIIQLGYQRALTYLRSDHSFSMWGTSDTNGSTWLTAYVTRVFAETPELLPNSSATVMKKAVQFLLDQQNHDGSFRESGKAIDSYIESGESKQVPLTAFTVLSFTKYIKTGKAGTEKSDASLQKAVAYLESKLGNIKSDTYALAITAYALAQANSSKKLDALGRLQDAVVQDASTAHWKTLESINDDREDIGYSYSAHAKDVEATAYALLACMANGCNWNMSLKIASWLISKQNTEDGFFSTADTAAALTALAEFAQSFTAAPSIQIDIMDAIQKRDVTIFPETAMAVHSVELAQKPTNIAIHARGSGLAVAYVSWTYNVLRPIEGWTFDLNVTSSRTESAKACHLSICARHWQEGASSITVMEVTALCGYQFEEEEVDQLLPAVKSVRKSELDSKGSQLNLYFDEMTSTAICFNLTMYQSYKVENLKARSVVIYDYYNPKDRRAVFYTPL